MKRIKKPPTHIYENLLVCIHNNSIITNQVFFVVNEDFMHYMLSSLDPHMLFIWALKNTYFILIIDGSCTLHLWFEKYPFVHATQNATHTRKPLYPEL